MQQVNQLVVLVGFDKIGRDGVLHNCLSVVLCVLSTIGVVPPTLMSKVLL